VSAADETAAADRPEPAGSAPPKRPRGRPKVLSRDQIVAAATELANTGGLERVSFRSLGARLGVAPMTVHRTIGGLDELHAELVRRAVDEATATFTWPADWQGVVRVFATTLADLLLRHPLVLESHSRLAPLVSTESDAVVARVVGALRAAGLPDDRAMYTFFVVYDFVVGHVAVRVGRGDRPDGRPERHRLVAELLGEHSYDERFAIGLDVLVAGIAAHLPSHVDRSSGSDRA
jgi:AcrR family transcriptional regulator